MPAAVAAVIDGKPSFEAGILIITLGRSTSHHSALASAVVLVVSWAMRGSTSMETRPSLPWLWSYCGRSTSHAQRMS